MSPQTRNTRANTTGASREETPLRSFTIGSNRTAPSARGPSSLRTGPTPVRRPPLLLSAGSRSAPPTASTPRSPRECSSDTSETMRSSQTPMQGPRAPAPQRSDRTRMRGGSLLQFDPNHRAKLPKRDATRCTTEEQTTGPTRRGHLVRAPRRNKNPPCRVVAGVRRTALCVQSARYGGPFVRTRPLRTSVKGSHAIHRCDIARRHPASPRPRAG